MGQEVGQGSHVDTFKLTNLLKVVCKLYIALISIN